MKAEKPCVLCEVDPAFNEHHLIPRHCHRKTWWKKRFAKEEMQRTISVCKMCHRSIHNLIPDEKKIGSRLLHDRETESSPGVCQLPGLETPPYVRQTSSRHRAVAEKEPHPESWYLGASPDSSNRQLDSGHANQ